MRRCGPSCAKDRPPFEPEGYGFIRTIGEKHGVDDERIRLFQTDYPCRGPHGRDPARDRLAGVPPVRSAIPTRSADATGSPRTSGPEKPQSHRKIRPIKEPSMFLRHIVSPLGGDNLYLMGLGLFLLLLL